MIESVLVNPWEPVASNPLTLFWLIVTTFFETGLGLGAYLTYTRIIPFFRTRTYMEILEAPMLLKDFFAVRRQQPFFRIVIYPIVRVIVGPKIRRIPNRWWIRSLFLRGLAFVTIVTVMINILLSVGWGNPFQEIVRNGIIAPGWLYNLVFSRSTNEPNGAHLMSFIGIPILALYSMWKYHDEFMGPLIGAFYVAIHEGPWEAAYYALYWQYLSFNQITNILKDVAFASMVIFFILAFWKYKNRKIRMSAFKWPTIIYLIALSLWIVIPYFWGYGLMPITTINNWEYGIGVYSITKWWADPVVNGIEVASWFGLFLMMIFVVWRDKQIGK